MSEQLSERGKDLVKYMPQVVNALADTLAVRLEERLLYGEKPQTEADVAEVKRGKWIKDRLVSTGGGTYGVYRCSRCEAYYQDVGYGFNYCPNCGAKMEGGADT